METNWEPTDRKTEKRWPDDECNDLKVMNVKIWKELALIREAWNYLTETAKPHKFLES